MNGIHDDQDLHFNGGGDAVPIPAEAHGAGDIGNKFRDPEIQAGFRAGLPEISKKHQVGYFRVLEEKRHDPVDGYVHPLGQGPTVDYFFHGHQLLPQILVDIQDHGLVQVPFFTPMIIEGGNVDAHPLGDHAGGCSVIAVFSEKLPGYLEDPGLHGFRVPTGFFQRGGHVQAPNNVSIK